MVDAWHGMPEGLEVDYVSQVQSASLPIIKQLCESRGWNVAEVENKHIQRTCGDLLLVKGSKCLIVECKADQGHWSSIFAEWQVDAISNESGWLIHCHADMLAYHFLTQGKVYLFKPSELRELVFRTKGVDQFKIRTQKQHKSFKDQLTIGLVIEAEDLRKLKSFKEFEVKAISRVAA